MFASLLRSLKCRQIGQVQLNISVNGTATTPVASGPDAAFVSSVADLGAGNYKITFKEKGQTDVHVSALVPMTDKANGRITAVDEESFTVQFDASDTGSALDSDFTAQIQFFNQLSYWL